MIALSSLVVAGCAASPALIVTGSSEPPPTDRDLPLRPWVPTEKPLPGKPGLPKKLAGLTLRQAVARALDYNPAVKAAFEEINAKNADAAQASYKPNPELSAVAENFAGSKGYNAFDQTETTVSLGQVIELGDKRVKRLAAAHLDAALSGWDYETARVQTAARAADLFVDALAFKERVAVLREFSSIAEEIRKGVATRVDSGKTSPIDLDRAVVNAARAKALADAEQLKFEAASAKLAAFWGADQPDFKTVSGKLGGDRRVPSLGIIRSLLNTNPQLARWSDEIARRYAILELERAKAVPDLTVSGGVRQFNEDNSTALVASVSIPLKVFDGNQGAIAAAERRAAKAKFDEEATRNELTGALAEALGELSASDAQARAFELKVLPAAKAAFDRTRTGYGEGKFDFLNVLDTQRSLFEVRLDLVNVHTEYAKARVKAEALIGRDLNEIPSR
jgi:cobalt-zinc-cadmium efflux system outer membrane protein